MAKPKRDKPVYMVIRRMADPSTGELIGCLVPDGWINQRIMKERKFHVNDLVRATLTKPRNSKFHRLVHGLGTLVKQNIEGFELLDSHAVIKRLQREAGVFCEEQEIEIPNIGKLLIKGAQSIAFDAMDESDFKQLWEGICRHIITTYWHDMTEEEISSMVELMPSQEAA